MTAVCPDNHYCVVVNADNGPCYLDLDREALLKHTSVTGPLFYDPIPADLIVSKVGRYTQ